MKFVYDLITILPFSLLLFLLCGTYAGIPEDNVWAYVLYLAMTSGMLLLRHMKKKNRLRSIAAVFVFLAGLILAAGENGRRLFLEESLWVIRTACFSAAGLFAGILADRSLWLRRILTAALGVYCIAGTVLAWDIRKLTFALVCMLLLVRVAEEIQRNWKKSGCPDRKEHTTRIAPFFLAVTLIVYLIPAPDTPYDWKPVKELGHAAVTGITRIYGSLTHPSENYGTVGFSDNGGFLGGLSGNDEEVLSIRAGSTPNRRFRLVGCISGEFEGCAWVFDTGQESCSRMLDTLETACAVKKFDADQRAEYLQKVDMHYETLFYNTQYIFAPAKIKMEITKEKTPGISDRNGGILSKRKLHYQDAYLISGYVLNNSHPHLEELLSDAKPITGAEWQQTAIAEKANNQTGCSFASYQQYRKEIYTQYCKSCDVSDEVRAILDDIRKPAENRYQVLKRLEAYLQSMDYSTDCGALPDTVTDAGSFLDHFLLTARKGYCMHFATAFVLMANEMDIPARYIQGYSVKRDAFGNITVRQSDAHAWAEAYFDNVGWIPFDPTPGCSLEGWEVRRFAQEATDPPEETEPASAEQAPDIQPEEREQAPALSPLLFIMPTLAVLGFLLFLYSISRFISRRSYRQMNASDKFRLLTQKSLHLLRLLGFRMEEDETLAEFTDRIMRSERTDVQKQIGFIPLYEASLYSDKEITEDDIRATEAAYQALRELVRKSKLRYRLLLLAA